VRIFFFAKPFWIGVLTLAALGFSQAPDSTQKVSLLPDRLGPMESVMWSQHGFMRRVFDFPLTEEGRESEIHLRRTMLTVHQMGGFATFAAMVATVTLGQLLYNGNRDLLQMHNAMAWTTVAAYFSTASLSIFTPPPLVRRNEWSTVSAHKLLATIHFTAMCIEPFLGEMVKSDVKKTGHSDLAPYHLALGYTELATFGAAMVVVSF
jgi:hypothetical protein